MEASRRAYIELHIAVFLFGFTAILGDLISISAVMIVWWRVLLTSISMLAMVRVAHMLRSIPKAQLSRFAMVGVLAGLHWITFYAAIKLSNASIALICFASTSLFTAFLEPIFLRQPIQKLQVFLGLLIIPAMTLIVNTVKPEMLTGVWVGLLSAFLAATFSTLNKKWIDQADPYQITFIELGSAWIFISLLLPFLWYFEWEHTFWPVGWDWAYLLLLVLLCTTLAYILQLRALKYVSAFAANLSINLEPVYGIILAILLLNEHKELSASFYFGVALITIIVFAYPLLNRWSKKNQMKNY